jgi:hypothetical protein
MTDAMKDRMRQVTSMPSRASATIGDSAGLAAAQSGYAAVGKSIGFFGKAMAAMIQPLCAMFWKGMGRSCGRDIARADCRVPGGVTFPGGIPEA